MKDILNAFRQGRHEFENAHMEGFDWINPHGLFELWMTDAVEGKEFEPNAFVLSTVDSDNCPSSRVVYLKDIIDHQFIFYTNYNSNKGLDIAANENVSMLFFSPHSSRQIRIQGKCTKVDPAISDDYFNSRPRSSKIGAWASNQSEVLSSRKELEDRVAYFESKFKEEIPRPEHWGGYQIKPTRFEFWQGRPSRLHDRIVFVAAGDTWEIHRMNP
ncbi:MAG: pyridoxamine 5'-phosphate oxidase [Crocinitomicaceae bacterium]|nr:pyridoxamine 5'-phosphate oxidase [Crocinitomicaceae bacterium]